MHLRVDILHEAQDLILRVVLEFRSGTVMMTEVRVGIMECIVLNSVLTKTGVLICV